MAGRCHPGAPLDADRQEVWAPRVVRRRGDAMAASGARRAAFDQRPDQAQQLLMLGAVAAADEEVPDRDVAGPAPGGDVGLVPDEHPSRTGVAHEGPAVAVRAAVKLSGVKWHAGRSCSVSGVLPSRHVARRATVSSTMGGDGGVPLRSGPLDEEGAAVPGIAATMTGVEAITSGLAAALAVGTVAFRASVPPAA